MALRQFIHADPKHLICASPSLTNDLILTSPDIAPDVAETLHDGMPTPNAIPRRSANGRATISAQEFTTAMKDLKPDLCAVPAPEMTGSLSAKQARYGEAGGARVINAATVSRLMQLSR